MKTITDIFGNAIEVPDLQKAIQQTENFVERSKEQTILFQEYFFTFGTDAQGRKVRITETPKNARTVTNLDFYNHQLKQLQNLE